MGLCASAATHGNSMHSTTSVYTPSSTTWAPLFDVNVTRSKYISSDQSLKVNCSALEVEFRALLDHPFFFSSIEHKHKEYPMILMWKAIACHLNKFAQSDAQLYAIAMELSRAAQTDNGKKETAHFISEINAIADAITLKAKLDMRLRIISGLRRVCFNELFDGFFLQFRHLPEYRSICSKMTEVFNKVEPDDFEYVSKLGAGAFGIVLHCRKKSTGRAYAMKIQSKAHLLMHHRSRPTDVMVEMRALAAFNHLYLGRLDYAFQSSTLVFLAMPLITCGDLEKSLNMSFYGWFSARRVQYYAAEIISALCYMHQRRIIFRDLKPSNVLLQEDGHIQLADFGSVCDLEERLDMYRDAESSAVCSLSGETPPTDASSCRAPIFGNSSAYSLENSHRAECRPLDNNSSVVPPSTTYLHPGSVVTTCPSAARSYENVPLSEVAKESSTNKVNVKTRRPTSLIGTLSYMAPEIILLYAKSSKHKNVEKTNDVPSRVSASNDGAVGSEGAKVDSGVNLAGDRLGNHYYSYSVDWWSLGALMFKLSTGKSPCRCNISYSHLHRLMPDIYRDCGGDMEKCINTLYKTANFLDPLDFLDSKLKDIIVNFMTVDPEKRLGGLPLDSSLEQMMSQQEIIKQASFFNDIDWDAIDNKKMPPPYIPKGETLDSVQYAVPSASSPARIELIQRSIQESNACLPICCCLNKAILADGATPSEPRIPMSSAVFEMTAAQAAAVAEARATQYPPLSLREILRRLKKLHWIAPLEPEPMEFPTRKVRSAKISPDLLDDVVVSNKETNDDLAAAVAGVPVSGLKVNVSGLEANEGEYAAKVKDHENNFEVQDSSVSAFKDVDRYQGNYSVAQEAARQAEEHKEVMKLHKKYQVGDDQQVYFEDWKFTSSDLIDEEAFIQQHSIDAAKSSYLLSKLSVFGKIDTSTRSGTLSVSWNNSVS